MDIFTRFNAKNIADRQIDTLIGICKGIISDGQVVQSEAEFLQTWLIQSKQCSKNPIIQNLLGKVENMLQDNILDPEESIELFNILRLISGDKSELGELGKTANLPINNPVPNIQFNNKSFLFTGTCAYGSRRKCQDIVKILGGKNMKRVTLSLDYLVLGTYVTDSWAHESFGRKIEKAMDYRDNKGAPLAIITEKDWLNEACV